jgi:hypothetical protein
LAKGHGNWQCVIVAAAKEAQQPEKAIVNTFLEYVYVLESATELDLYNTEAENEREAGKKGQ